MYFVPCSMMACWQRIVLRLLILILASSTFCIWILFRSPWKENIHSIFISFLITWFLIESSYCLAKNKLPKYLCNTVFLVCYITMLANNFLISFVSKSIECHYMATYIIYKAWIHKNLWCPLALYIILFGIKQTYITIGYKMISYLSKTPFW